MAEKRAPAVSDAPCILFKRRVSSIIAADSSAFTSSCDRFRFRNFEVHTKDQAVVEPLLVAGVRGVFARWPMPSAVAIVAVVVRSPVRV